MSKLTVANPPHMGSTPQQPSANALATSSSSCYSSASSMFDRIPPTSTTSLSEVEVTPPMTPVPSEGKPTLDTTELETTPMPLIEFAPDRSVDINAITPENMHMVMVLINSGTELDAATILNNMTNRGVGSEVKAEVVVQDAGSLDQPGETSMNEADDSYMSDILSGYTYNTRDESLGTIIPPAAPRLRATRLDDDDDIPPLSLSDAPPSGKVSVDNFLNDLTGSAMHPRQFVATPSSLLFAPQADSNSLGRFLHASDSAGLDISKDLPEIYRPMTLSDAVSTDSAQVTDSGSIGVMNDEFHVAQEVTTETGAQQLDQARVDHEHDIQAAVTLPMITFTGPDDVEMAQGEDAGFVAIPPTAVIEQSSPIKVESTAHTHDLFDASLPLDNDFNGLGIDIEDSIVIDQVEASPSAASFDVGNLTEQLEAFLEDNRARAVLSPADTSVISSTNDSLSEMDESFTEEPSGNIASGSNSNNDSTNYTFLDVPSSPRKSRTTLYLEAKQRQIRKGKGSVAQLLFPEAHEPRGLSSPTRSKADDPFAESARTPSPVPSPSLIPRWRGLRARVDSVLQQNNIEFCPQTTTTQRPSTSPVLTVAPVIAVAVPASAQTTEFCPSTASRRPKRVGAIVARAPAIPRTRPKEFYPSTTTRHPSGPKPGVIRAVIRAKVFSSPKTAELCPCATRRAASSSSIAAIASIQATELRPSTKTRRPSSPRPIAAARVMVASNPPTEFCPSTTTRRPSSGSIAAVATAAIADNIQVAEFCPLTTTRRPSTSRRAASAPASVSNQTTEFCPLTTTRRPSSSKSAITQTTLPLVPRKSSASSTKSTSSKDSVQTSATTNSASRTSTTDSAPTTDDGGIAGMNPQAWAQVVALIPRRSNAPNPYIPNIFGVFLQSNRAQTATVSEPSENVGGEELVVSPVPSEETEFSSQWLSPDAYDARTGPRAGAPTQETASDTSSSGLSPDVHGGGSPDGQSPGVSSLASSRGALEVVDEVDEVIDEGNLADDEGGLLGFSSAGLSGSFGSLTPSHSVQDLAGIGKGLPSHLSRSRDGSTISSLSISASQSFNPPSFHQLRLRFLHTIEEESGFSPPSPSLLAHTSPPIPATYHPESNRHPESDWLVSEGHARQDGHPTKRKVVSSIKSFLSHLKVPAFRKNARKCTKQLGPEASTSPAVIHAETEQTFNLTGKNAPVTMEAGVKGGRRGALFHPLRRLF